MGGLKGRGRGARRNPLIEGQAHQHVPAAPVTHTDLATLSAHLEQRFTKLITVAMPQNQPVPAVSPTPAVPHAQELVVQ